MANVNTVEVQRMCPACRSEFYVRYNGNSYRNDRIYCPNCGYNIVRENRTGPVKYKVGQFVTVYPTNEEDRNNGLYAFGIIVKVYNDKAFYMMCLVDTYGDRINQWKKLDIERGKYITTATGKYEVQVVGECSARCTYEHRTCDQMTMKVTEYECFDKSESVVPSHKESEVKYLEYFGKYTPYGSDKAVSICYVTRNDGYYESAGFVSGDARYFNLSKGLKKAKARSLINLYSQLI